jgi:hypothetical protein
MHCENVDVPPIAPDSDPVYCVMTRKPFEDIYRTPFECFGHNEKCDKWVEGSTSINLDHSRPCTCGGKELDPDEA